MTDEIQTRGLNGSGALVQRPHILEVMNSDGKRAQWVVAHRNYPHDEYCLIWPFRFSEGVMQLSGSVSVCRVMCEYLNGPPPSDLHQAAHSCGRRLEGCVNPRHLSWKTNSENQKERYEHSGFVPRAKLTPEQVDEIRSLKDRSKVSDLAKQFGVSGNNIRSILAGRLWNNTSTLQRRVFTDDEIRMIRTSTKMQKDLAEELGVKKNVIQRICARETYKYVGDES